MRDCMCIITPVSPIDFERTSPPRQASHPQETVTCQLPGTHIEPCFLSFQEDALGIELRAHLGVDTLLWGSDYPHAESTFPRSRAIVDRILQGVPEAEQAQIAGGNTARLYHFA